MFDKSISVGNVFLSSIIGVFKLSDNFSFFLLMTKKTNPIKIIIQDKIIKKIQNCFCCYQSDGSIVLSMQLLSRGPVQTVHPLLHGEHVFVEITE